VMMMTMMTPTPQSIQILTVTTAEVKLVLQIPCARET